jgi:hypothetical protein
MYKCIKNNEEFVDKDGEQLENRKIEWPRRATIHFRKSTSEGINWRDSVPA